MFKCINTYPSCTDISHIRISLDSVCEIKHGIPLEAIVLRCEIQSLTVTLNEHVKYNEWFSVS